MQLIQSTYHLIFIVTFLFKGGKRILEEIVYCLGTLVFIVFKRTNLNSFIT